MGTGEEKHDLARAGVKKAWREMLAKFMGPDRVVGVGQLPKNANGKIDRKAIAATIETAEV
mgnify:CR=1 FL=1